MNTWHTFFSFLIILELRTFDAVATEAFSHIPVLEKEPWGGALYHDLFAGICPPQTTASCVCPRGGRFNMCFVFFLFFLINRRICEGCFIQRLSPTEACWVGRRGGGGRN